MDIAHMKYFFGNSKLSPSDYRTLFVTGTGSGRTPKKKSKKQVHAPVPPQTVNVSVI